MLDQVMEFGMYQSNMHAFAGCTSIVSWGGHSADGATYLGRNMDWAPTFNEFAQVTRDLMGLTLFDADGNFLENGGCTKPILQDADSTYYKPCSTRNGVSCG